MKDKLRELAAEWLRKGEFSKNSGAPRCGGQMIEDAKELLEILDAEGDGGAVACCHDWAEGYGVPAYCNHCGVTRDDAATPEAWLHEVIANDGIADLALSFEPDSFPFADVAGYQSIKHSPLYTHPARSGVVSDEDVVGAVDVFDRSYNGLGSTKSWAMRAALESYERNRK